MPSAIRANTMELLTKLTRLHSQLIDNNNVLCPKNIAKDFFIYLKMLDINVTYKLSGTKILFTVK